MSERPDHTQAWMRFDGWIKRALELGASDIHLVAGHKPQVRISGKLSELDDFLLDRTQTRWVGICLGGNDVDYRLNAEGYMHLTRDVNDEKYAAITLAMASGAVSVSIRLHGGRIPTLAQSNVPEAVTRLLSAPNGLVLVAGPHASGKTTTLYSMTQWVNENRALHICTVEKPRHYIFKPAKSIIQQREVGRDCPTAARAIDAAMHQDLDVLVVGEISDFETLAACLQAAETGHLVLVQLHANDAREAVMRLVEAAPESMHPQIKRQVANTLRGVIVQRLATLMDGKTRMAVCDVMGEGARKLLDNQRVDAGAWLVRVQDEIAKLESGRKISADEAARLLREVGA